jgi:hypothetical protein
MTLRILPQLYERNIWVGDDATASVLAFVGA